MTRVYVVCLESHNNCKTHGGWVDVVDGDSLKEDVKNLLKESPYGGEEFAIHDYEGFDNIRIGEYDSLDRVGRLAEYLNNNESDFPESVLSEVLDYVGGNIEDAESYLENSFIGHADSFEDYLYDLYQGMGETKVCELWVYLKPHFFEEHEWDYEIIATDSGVYIFNT